MKQTICILKSVFFLILINLFCISGAQDTISDDEILELFDGLRVADGDGVIAVPREHAKETAEYAREILNKDKKGRRGLYQNLGMPLDKTVEIEDKGDE